MKKIYYLKTCDTCKKIMKQLDLSDFTLREIKSEPITEQELIELRNYVSSYEELFNKRSRKYRELNLKEKPLNEKEIKQLILDEYTFLKRPVMLFEDQVLTGNSKKVVSEMVRATSDS
ncbi:MAG: ArsC/Spx/MgsR family protein [Salibacter sp.]|uniref:arsenate reductase family protein n=1 Tax=Salibacter sp. TaxID=2010995 RepID=UPI002870362D|nr:ArsC/Spx/MgsR family protein [Salibacter sp.]MDR9397622.1 ArsC/Spx/MgsR family protein [Salibacter sp.]